MKKIYNTLSFLLLSTMAMGQSWSYVATPNLTGPSTYLYFGDLEIDASGTAYVGYWDNSGKLGFAKSNGSTWTTLPSPGTFAVSLEDIEIYGSDYYISYMGVRGSNLYAFVRKYDGSSAWTYVGDSILIGGVGQGGSFDFLLDKNGVPTLVGIQKAAFGEKTVKQFTGGIWSNTDTIPGSSSTIYSEGSAIFDANNKLLTSVTIMQTLSVPPFVVYKTICYKIDGSLDSVLGDTLAIQGSTTKLKLDNANNPHLLTNAPLQKAFLTYKLNGTKWDITSDTTGAIGSMQNADLSADGKAVFNIMSANLAKNFYLYNAGVRTNMDSLYANGLLASIADIKIHGSDAYVLFMEINSSSQQGYSVKKHALTGSGTSLAFIENSEDRVKVFPNPASEFIQILTQSEKANIWITDIHGKQLLEAQTLNGQATLPLSSLQRGLYFVLVQGDDNATLSRKIVVE